LARKVATCANCCWSTKPTGAYSPAAYISQSVYPLRLLVCIFKVQGDASGSASKYLYVPNIFFRSVFGNTASLCFAATVVKSQVIESRDGAAVATSILTTFLQTSPGVMPGIEKRGRGRPVTPPSLLRINEPRSDRPDYYHHKTPGKIGPRTRSMNPPRPGKFNRGGLLCN
jgi:hypothetical protein